MVASTLVCLSELVPILGADTVIGGKRAKYFSDGRPNTIKYDSVRKNENINNIPVKSLKEFQCSEEIFEETKCSNNFDKPLILTERPSPVGGESVEIDNNIEHAENHSEDDWGDWDNTTRKLVMTEDQIDFDNVKETIFEVEKLKNEKVENKSKTSLMEKAALEAKNNIVDISELDIKNQKIDHSRKGEDEFDFFADMMPVIEKPAVVTIDAPNTTEFSSKLSFIPNEENEGIEDWGENWND